MFYFLFSLVCLSIFLGYFCAILLHKDNLSKPWTEISKDINSLPPIGVDVLCYSVMRQIYFVAHLTSVDEWISSEQVIPKPISQLTYWRPLTKFT
jgi:hypothetical protein